MKESVKFGVILLLFCAISAGLLALVNSFTAPVIAQTQLEQTLASYKTIFGDKADDFAPLDQAKLSEIQKTNPAIKKVFIAKKGGKTIGYGVNVTSNGFGGEMENALGFLLEGDKIAGFRNITNAETKGFGTRMVEPEYYESYKDKSAAAPLEISKNPQKENQVLWMSGATVSSKAILQGSNAAVKVYSEVLKGLK